jgi:tetratricopeptide (TPR) repeat protein
LAALARERRISTAWLAVPAVLVLTGCGIVSHRQIARWHDSESLWKYTISVTGDNYMAHDGLARALAKDGHSEEAIMEFKATEKLHAYSTQSLLDLGQYEQTHGHVQDALDDYARALESSSDPKERSTILSWLGSAFTRTGQIDRAKMSYVYALRENPDNSVALVGSGLLAERAGDSAFAVTQITHAMKVQPTDVGYLLLEQALRREGHASEADAARAQAERISQDLPQARETAAQVLVAAGIK